MGGAPVIPESVQAPRVVREDGRTPFLAPQAGVAPTADSHFVTKGWAMANLGGAPAGAEYLLGSPSAGLSAGRVLVNSFAIEWDWLTAGEVKANLGSGVVPALLGVMAGYFAPLVHVHAASDITSGTFAVARLGSGTPSSLTWLRGDGSWQGIPASSISVDSSGWSGLLAGAGDLQECLDRIDGAVSPP